MQYSDTLTLVLEKGEAEARDYGAENISTDSLLLGITRVPDCLGALQLVRANTTLLEVQAMVTMGRSANRLFGVELRMTPRAERVLQLAHDVSVQANCSTVGTHHLLAALLLEGEGLAAVVLHRLGMEAETLKAAVVRLSCEE